MNVFYNLAYSRSYFPKKKENALVSLKTFCVLTIIPNGRAGSAKRQVNSNDEHELLAGTYAANKSGIILEKIRISTVIGKGQTVPVICTGIRHSVQVPCRYSGKGVV